MDTVGYAKSTLAQAGASIQTAPSLPAMVDMIQRAAAVNDRLNLATDRIGRFLDRCHGPRPEASCGEGPRAVPSGHLDAFGDQFRAIETSLTQLENVADALDRIG